MNATQVILALIGTLGTSVAAALAIAKIAIRQAMERRSEGPGGDVVQLQLGAERQARLEGSLERLEEYLKEFSSQLTISSQIQRETGEHMRELAERIRQIPYQCPRTKFPNSD